ncbi:MAG: hypothetical protein AAGA77_20430 [Bacteroidota bacterium]
MKHLLLTTVLLFFFFASSAQTKFGAGGVLNLDNLNSIGVTGKVHHTFDDDFAGQGSFVYYFEDITLYAIDLDVHYSGFDIALGDFAIRPFGGLNIFRISVGGFGDTDINLNLGVSGTKDLGSVELFIEPKIIIGSGSALNIAGGVYF